MEDYKRVAVDKKTYFRIFAVFFVPCLLFAAVCFGYYKQLNLTLREESKSYLLEISGRISNNVDRIIADNFSVLSTVSSLIEAQSAAEFAEISGMLQVHKQNWNYKSIIMVDEKGQSYDLKGAEVFFTMNDQMRSNLLSGKKAMSTTQVINNEEYIMFSVPVNKAIIGGKTIVAVMASYDPRSFDKTLSMKSFDQQSYSQLVTKNGSAITRPTATDAINAGYNIFSSLETTQLESKDSLETMRQTIATGGTGLVDFSINNIAWYMVYTPAVSENWYLLTFVPVQVVNEKSDILLRTTLLLCGLITVTFAALLAALYAIFNKHKRNLEKIAYVDPVTGGNTIQRFYQLTEETLQSADAGKHYALLYTNIEKFKVLNEQLGRRSCDNILQLIYQYIHSYLQGAECIGRLSADNFCVLLEFESEAILLERFKLWRDQAELHLADKMPWGLPIMEFGVYIITDKEMALSLMIDRAKLALKGSLWAINSKLLYAFYDDDVRRRIFRDKQLEDRMESALANREFQVYLQPKYDISADHIGGAEALVRWNSPTDGMIYPDEFISLFEKNGFIVLLDRWVFEEVCKTLRDWAAQGRESLMVSVNCSKVHFKHPSFLEPYVRIAEQYGIDKNLIEIEITESIVFENTDLLIRIINQIKEAGFSCSMDDFGSGYSSLNMLQRIPIDTLKLDKSFFRVSTVSGERTEAIVQSVVSMAQALSMKTVAEGVEYVEQMSMLRAVGCDYIQGYWYAKPMSIEAFEEFAFGRSTSRREQK